MLEGNADRPGEAVIICAILMPEDSPIGQNDTEEMALHSSVLSTVNRGGPGWTRTNDLSLIRTAL